MTENLRPAQSLHTASAPDFDLVEDLGAADPNDQEAFDRALSALLPQEGAPADGRAGVDIDLDDFEAFNRELDARLAEAHVQPAEDDSVEDLGAEIIHAAAPLPTPTPAPAPKPAEPSPATTLAVADDVVTLGAAALAAGSADVATAAPSRTVAGAPATAAQTVPPAPAATEPAPSVPARKGGGLAIVLGAAGLVAGAAALWVSHSREADLARLQGALAEVAASPSQPVAPPPTPAPDERRLEARLTEIDQRLETLGAAVTQGSASSARALRDLEERLGRAEAQVQIVAAKAEQAAKTPAAVEAPAAPAKIPATEPPKAASEPPPATPKAPPKPKEPARAAAGAPTKTGGESVSSAPAKPAEPPVAAPEPTGTEPAPTPAATTASGKAKKPLPKAADGAWVVVVGSFPTEAEAYRRLNRVEGTGLVADVVPADISGQTWHRLVVPGYASQDDAKAVAADLRARGLGQPWVLQRGKSE